MLFIKEGGIQHDKIVIFIIKFAICIPYILLLLFKFDNKIGRDGVAPPESEDSEFTVHPAPTYGISTHIQDTFKITF